jgi:hypothetical protein
MRQLQDGKNAELQKNFETKIHFLINCYGISLHTEPGLRDRAKSKHCDFTLRSYVRKHIRDREF